MNIFYLFIILMLILGVSTFSGHVLIAPAVSIYLALLLLLFSEELECVGRKLNKNNKVSILALHLGYGGLDIELKSSELDKLNQCIDEQQRVNGIQSSYVYETGVVHLDGVQATAYARIRSTDQGDITRAWRQRKVISLMIEKAKSAG